MGTMSAGDRSASPVRRIGRYALYGEIASGGMATVYVGRLRGQAGFARTVAIKRLHPQHAKEPDFVAMFLDEARLAARIRHPNVVPTLDVVSTEGELFLVMEYVQGESFARLLRATRQRQESAPVRVVAAIVADVLHGLHAAHEATSEKGVPLGLVHRDVSPHNILVGSDGVARVVDFGVAKAAGRIQSTREGQLKGKLAYMAPEQITGTATRRTDVYAASVVLWEALTGRRMFIGENDASVLNQVLHSPIVPPSQHVAGLDPAWDEIVLKGLERDEAQRYATAREMALEIERRMTLARATEVGGWVDSLAHETLARRAAEVTSVESASDLDLVPAEAESIASEPVSGSHSVSAKSANVAPRSTIPDVPPAGESSASHLSAVSAVAKPLTPSIAPRRRSRTPVVAVVGVIAVGVAAAVAWGITATRSALRTNDVPGAVAADPPSTTTPAPSVEPPAVPAPPPPSPVATTTTTATATTSSSAPVAASSARAGATIPAHPHRAPRAKIEPVPTATKAPSLGGVLDSRH
jgi:serine/threonine-protein kinase